MSEPTELASAADWSGEERGGERDLRRDSETRKVAFREEWKERNFSTDGWGSSSLADELNSAYMLQKDER